MCIRDSYSSTKDILVPLAERGLIKKGLIIRFDEYWNFRVDGGPDTQHESRAWEEVAEEFGIEYAPLFWFGQALSIIVTSVADANRTGRINRIENRPDTNRLARLLRALLERAHPLRERPLVLIGGERHLVG